MTGALTEFLLERLAEDEALAPDTHREGCPWMTDQLDDCDCAVPARVLADVEAKRAIVNRARGWLDEEPDGTATDVIARDLLGHVVLALAQPYRDHPDFDPAWS